MVRLNFGVFAVVGFIAGFANTAIADDDTSDLRLPHPDGEISVDVSRVAVDTQARIMEKMADCLQEGFEFADADGNGAIEGDEKWDWIDERAFCAETAQRDFSIAESKARIAEAEARSAEAEAGIAEARARISALTDELLKEAREENGF